MAAANSLDGSGAERQPPIPDKTRSRMIVALPAKPCIYKPGCGPPLQPVFLAPVNDSTGYIIERILLPSPGVAKDGRPLPKRMTYIVGWRDLPAASMLVPAMDILDYVSPRTLEEWEEMLGDEMDKQRARLADAKLAAHEQARVRPPAHTAIEAAAAVEPGPEERPKTGAMSLSTPQKRKLADFEGLSDDASPSDQIARELLYDNSHVRESELHIGWDDTPSLKRENGTSLGERLMSAASQKQHEYADSDDIPATKQQTHSLPASRASPTKKVTAVPLPIIPGFHHVRTSTPETSTSTRTSSPSRPESKKKKKTAQKPVKPVNGEPLWEVQRLEDMAIYDVQGQGIGRYFKVRWAGDWPDDQNPSWEPEDNIPDHMVRNYFQRGKGRKEKGENKRALPKQATSIT